MYRSTPSDTAPTLKVFVIIIGHVKRPVSSMKWDPLNFPFPLNRKIPAKHGLRKIFGRGSIAVMPVRIVGGWEIVSVEAVTFGISVIEFFGPGDKEPRWRFGKRSRKRQRSKELMRADLAVFDQTKFQLYHSEAT
jgi:hypothetical protein